MSEKSIMQTYFEGKNSCKEIPGGKIPTLKKVSLVVYNSVCQGKKILTQTKSPITPQKPDGRPLTIYFEHGSTGKPAKNPTGKSNGSRHSGWETSESIGCDLRSCNFSTLLSLFMIS